MSVPADTRNSVWLSEARPCWHCGTPTHWAELSFEAPLCPGPCTAAKWREFHEASHDYWPVSYTCPHCGRTSHHPDDARHGYCSACHDFTEREEPPPVAKTTTPTPTYFRFCEAAPGCAGGHVQFTVHVGTTPGSLALAGRLTMTQGEAEHFRQLVDNAYDPDDEWHAERSER